MSVQESKSKVKRLKGKTQQDIFHYMYFTPGSTLKEAASACHVSYYEARQAWSRLKRSHNIYRLCPNCYNETLYADGCHICGFKPDRDQELLPGYADAKAHEPVNRMLPGNGVGTQVNYKEFHFMSGASAVMHSVEHGRGVDRKYETLKAKLLKKLEEKKHEDYVMNFAARLLKREYKHFLLFYPDLMNKHGFDDIFLKGVERQLSIWGVTV